MGKENSKNKNVVSVKENVVSVKVLTIYAFCVIQMCCNSTMNLSFM